jgi:hypothetical protein
MSRLCNCPYSREAVKNCRRGYWKDGEMFCLCTKNCAECYADSKRMVPMHADLNAEYKASIAIRTNQAKEKMKGEAHVGENIESA